ncbi:MAG: Peptidase M50 [Clostridiales bacterium 38_11]|nr:MAG: Peptidase M50 [Clostridiales bacterium 38_11]HBH11810.1 hypothetical protein [Clostridiales bacterium]
MKGSFVIGKIKGIEIEINLSWLVIFGLITFMMATNFFPQNYPELSSIMGWILGSIIAVLMLLSILLHELSHSIVSIKQGIDVKKITLFIFGGIAQMDKEPDNPIQELKIALAGPAMSLLLFVIFTLIFNLLTYLRVESYIIAPLIYVSSVNLIIVLFNMVPAFPLDGGRVLRALIWHFQGSLLKATRITSSLGKIFGYLLVFLGLYVVFMGNALNGIWFVFIGWFIKQLSESSYQNTVMTDLFTKIKVSTFMSKNVISVGSHISIEALVENYFYKFKYTSFPVIDSDKVIGMVTVENIKTLNREEWNRTIIRNLITPISDDLIVHPQNNVSVAIKKIFQNGIGRVLVMDGEAIIGIVSRTDILNYIRIHSQLEE